MEKSLITSWDRHYVLLVEMRQKKHIRKLKNIEQMRLDFFANVSHELRTPVTVIRGYTESLVDGIVTDETRRQQKSK